MAYYRFIVHYENKQSGELPIPSITAGGQLSRDFLKAEKPDSQLIKDHAENWLKKFASKDPTNTEYKIEITALRLS